MKAYRTISLFLLLLLTLGMSAPGSFADAEISGAHQSFVSKAGEHYSYQGLQASAGALIDEINHTDAFAEYSPTALILLGMAAILFFLKKKSRKTHHATQI